VSQSLHPGSEIIRRASKATVAMQVFSVLLLVGLAVIFAAISHRYATLQDGIRENALWSVYQLDREARKLHETLHFISIRGEPDKAALKEASQRYDILYSRMIILDEGKFDRRFGGEHDAGPALSDIRLNIKALESVFDGIAKGGNPSLAVLISADDTAEDLLSRTEALLIYANNAVSSDRADARERLMSLQIKSAMLVVTLVLSVVFLIHSLNRQLRAVRAAGLSFETITNDLQTAYQAADAGNRAKSQFMATMGHEIRTPLNGILGTAELLQLAALPDHVRQSVATIRKSGEALLEIINEILDYAKIESGMLTMEFRPTDLELVARAAIDIVSDRALENGNSIQLEIPEQLVDPVVFADPTRLKQVLLNLLSNAAKFTTNGRITVKILQLKNDVGCRTRFEISDTGIGIDQEGLAKLFRPFSQVDATINRRFGGTGLGLTICLQIVEAMGGKIGAESEKGRGSTFWLELPAPAAPIKDARETAPAPTTCMSSLARMKILLVEDNKVNQDVARGFLAKLGQEVVVAGDGAEGVDIASIHDFDLVLMDMQMPGMDGLEATRRIRRRDGQRGRVPIVAMTANASEDDRQLCSEAGMDGFQSKPLSLAKLRELILSIQRYHALPVSADHKFQARRQEVIEALGEDGWQELLVSFFDDASGLLRKLDHAVSRGEVNDVDRLLHTFKGAASSVGFQNLADECQKLRGRGVTANDLRELDKTIFTHRTFLAA